MSSIDYSKIDNYTNEVCSLIKNKKVHENIKLELTSHIEELYDSYIEEGLNSDDALSKAISQMGDSTEIGKSLNRVHKATPDWSLISMTTFFILFGLFTSDFFQSNIEFYKGYSSFAHRSAISAILGASLTLILLKIDYRNIKKYSKHIYFSTIILLIVGTLFGLTINGVSGYIAIGPITFNIYYSSIFFLPIALSGIFNDLNWNNKKDLFKGLIFSFIPCIFYFLGNSYSNMGIFIVTSFTLMIVSGLKFKYVALSFTSLFTLFSVLVLSVPYRVERFFAFINPSKDPQGSGWIYNQLKSLRDSAGLFGQGASFESMPLTDAHSEFVLSYITYSFGWFTTILLVLLILTFIVRIGFVAAYINNSYGKLLVSSFCALFAIQFLMSILINLSLSPIFGISMPFISYGGTNTLMNIISIALISNVYKYRNTPFAKMVKS